MSIINQPFQGQLGEILRGELNANYTSFTIFQLLRKKVVFCASKSHLNNLEQIMEKSRHL